MINFIFIQKNNTTKEFIENRNDEQLILAISNGSIAIGNLMLCPPSGFTFYK